MMKRKAAMRGAMVFAAAMSLLPGMASAQSASADGELRKVDAASRRVIISHGEWKGMNMQPMTMGFRLRDSVNIDGFKAADKVRFTVEREGRDFVVTAIERNAAAQSASSAKEGQPHSEHQGKHVHLHDHQHDHQHENPPQAGRR